MPSTYSNLGLELQATGENSNTWGELTNVNLQRIDNAIAGYSTVQCNSTTITLTFSTNVSSTTFTDENGRNKVLKFTSGTAGAPIVVTVPDVEKEYLVENTSGQAITFTAGGSTTYQLATGKTAHIYIDGASAVYNALDNFVASTIDSAVIGGTDPAAGTFTNLTATGNFTSTGIDDNATSTAITIGSDERVHINGTPPASGTRIDPADETSGLNIYKTTEDASISLFRDDTSTVNGEIIGSLRGLVNDNNSSGFYVRTGEIDFIASATHSSTVRNTDIVFKTMSGTTLSQKMRIADDGDISFYEDTGTTPKFFWDASAERLGIGTSTPDVTFQVIHDTSSARIGRNTGQYFQLSGDAGSNYLRATGKIMRIGTSSVHDFALETNNQERMRITSNGSVGIGTTSPASNLEVYKSVSVSGASNQNVLTVTAVDNDGGFFYAGLGAGIALRSGKTSASAYGPEIMGAIYGANSFQESVSNGYLTFHTRLSDTLSERMRIDRSGNVGIGTSSPTAGLQVESDPGIIISRSGFSQYMQLQPANNSVPTILGLGGNGVHIGPTSSTGIRIDNSGNVGIGTASPSSQLTVSTSSSTVAKIVCTEDGTTASRITLYKDSSSPADGDGIGFVDFNANDSGDTEVVFGRIGVFAEDVTAGTTDGSMRFYTRGNNSNTEAMRIDSSGNVLVGKTAVDTTSEGVVLANQSYFTRTGGNTAFFNRNTSDGNIIAFGKDGTTVGSIVYNSGNFAYAGSSSSLVLYGSGVLPGDGNGSNTDNVKDLGEISFRWDDIYATNGTIQTSDQNEKQSIQSLTSSEIAVAQRISKLFKTFKFNSSVEEKGDSARTHTGIIAQDVQQAFIDEGLDASNYALFISSTWWEKEISVDAVAEELDEEGNVIVEGKDAYTYMDTKKEATEGYTEKTRLGIRYPELLSFVSSAFEQRLTNIETRLTALET